MDKKDKSDQKIMTGKNININQFPLVNNGYSAQIYVFHGLCFSQFVQGGSNLLMKI